MNLQGHLLIASPELRDPNFRRTVLLIIRHDEDGAFGVVLNRRGNAPIAKIWQAATGQTCAANGDKLAMHGGPCAGAIMALHGAEEWADFQVVPGVYCSIEPATLQDAIDCLDADRFEFYTGYAGWAPGQLEGELEAGGWLHTPATVEFLLNPGDDPWRRALNDVGEHVLSAALGGRPAACDPSLN